MTVDTFTAVAECPACHLWDVHRMRNPLVADQSEKIKYSRGLTEWQKIEDNVKAEIKVFPGRTIRTIYRVPPPRKLIDESMYEVIRICKCGKEWGQR